MTSLAAIQLGTLGEWAASMAGLGAIVVALRLPLQAEARAQDRAALGEASQVLAQMTWWSPSEARVELRNFSSGVLRTVQVRCEWNGLALDSLVQAKNVRVAYQGNAAIAVLHHLEPGADDAWIQFTRPDPATGGPEVAVWWTDRTGRTWRTAVDGLPDPAESTPAIADDDWQQGGC